MSEDRVFYGDPARGVGFKDVSVAADALLRLGERPTVEKIRTKIGSGSPNTIGPLLDEWWKRLAGRLDHGPAAFHRLPESVSHIAEALWLRALDEARGRALLEQTLDRKATDQDKERTEVRSHVLSLREAELDLRLRERDKLIAEMESRLQLLAATLRREQAGRNELARKLAVLEAMPSPVPTKASLPKQKRSTRKAKIAKRTQRKSAIKRVPPRGPKKPKRSGRR